MGDRGNIVLEGFHGTDGGRIYLYTHWGGETIYSSLAATLSSKRGRNRWGDDTYLTRHIAEDLFEMGGIVGDETGGGIGLAAPDNEHLFIVLNHARQEVYLEVDAAREESMASYGIRAPLDYGLSEPKPWSFEQYIAIVAACPSEMDTERFLLQAAGGTWPWSDNEEDEET